MLGLPAWVWIVIVLLALPTLFVGLLYGRFRKLCRDVREELRAYTRENHPDLKIVGEAQGNLVVRDRQGNERTWEMSDVYVAVGRLPGRGTPADRAAIYASAVAAILHPKPDRSQPLSMETHGDSIRLHLVTAESLRQDPPPPNTAQAPIPGLEGLRAVYLLELADGLCYLTEEGRHLLGVDSAELHHRALEHLRRGFPSQMVGDVLSNGNPAAIQFRDTFDATRLLLVPGYLKENEELLALVPHRDMLVLLPASMRHDPAKLEQAQQALNCDGHPRLLDRPVRVTRNGFELAPVS